MEISDVKVKLMGERSDRLKAFCSVTIDKEFVIRDLKIIEGTGGTFVAMPSRKITDKCPSCGAKNHLRAKFCNECGGRLNESRAARDTEGRTKLHSDIAHPINSGCREKMQQAIIRGYGEEVEKSKQPGYTSRYDEDFDEIDYVERVPTVKRPSAEREPQCAADVESNEESSGEARDSREDRKDSFGVGIL